MNSPDGLEFLCRVQYWFNKQYMSSFNQIEAVCTQVNGQQQNIDFTGGLEALQILLRCETQSTYTELLQAQHRYDLKVKTSKSTLKIFRIFLDV